MLDNGTPVIKHAVSTDYADTNDVVIRLADGLKLELWAPKSLLANPVSLAFDNQGFAYVTETARRQSSDIDIRAHTDWMVEDLALESLDDTRALVRAKLDPASSTEQTWQTDFNEDGSHDWRDLEVQTERIHRIWDSDGDGRADASNVYAEGFNSMLTGVAAGVVAHHGDVFLSVAPDLWRLRDEDGDGDADMRASISHGYGIHIGFAGHDMSGLTAGPDGKVYWSIGDLGVNTVGPDGTRWAYPHEGAVMRANPDGSDFEVFARGLRNPQEIAFDAYGNLFSVDNDGDHAGERERVVHIVEGSDSGWRIYWQYGKYSDPDGAYKVWMDEDLHLPYFKGQAAYILPPIALAHGGPAGFAFNPGTALGAAWKDHFFVTYFTGSAARSRMFAFQIEPSGSSYSVVSDREVMGGIQGTGITFGPDGALYVADWLEGYSKKQGSRIWRLDVTDSTSMADRKATQALLAEGMEERSSEDLLGLLQHADMRVRLEAQFALVRRADASMLGAATRLLDHQLARLHGIWGIGQLAQADPNYLAMLMPLLNDADAEVRAQTAKVFGERQHSDAIEALVLQLNDPSPRAQFYAAEALGKLGVAHVIDSLVALLEEVEDRDLHLRHSVVLALSRIGDQDALGVLNDHRSPHVRIGAVVALRKMGAPKVADFVRDADAFVRTEAARAIHDDDSIEDALPVLAEALGQAATDEEAFVRRAVNANLRVGGAEAAQRLAAFAASTQNAELRVVAIQALGYWDNPPVLDRVEGRYREISPHDVDEAHTALDTIVSSLLQDSNASVRMAALQTIGTLRYASAEANLLAMAQAAQESPDVRRAALHALAALESESTLVAVESALEASDVEVRRDAQHLLTTLNIAEASIVPLLQTVLTTGALAEQQGAFASLAAFTGPEAEQVLGTWMDDLMAGSVSRELHLDVLEAARQSTIASVQRKHGQYEAQRPTDVPLDAYREVLYGGNVEQGQQLVLSHQAAQCSRCHVVQQDGSLVGPSLQHMGSNLTREQLLEALIDPSTRIAPGYGSVALMLSNGDQVSGTFLGETEEQISVQVASGETQMISKNQIEERQNGVSAMPSMAGVLTKAELRDVVAYLATLQ